MARRRRRKDDGTEALATMLTIMLVGGFFLIKWAIEAIVWLFKVLAGAIAIGADKASKKQNVNNITKKPFNNVIVKSTPHNQIDTKEEVKQKMNLFDKSVYDDIFEKQIRVRGEQYYNDDKIKYLRQTENKYTCRVQGTEEYKVSITFNKDNMSEIESASCTCPYFADKQKNCKHIYGALVKIKCNDNHEKIKQEITKYFDGMKVMIENSKKYINNYRSHFTSAAIQDHENYCNDYEWEIQNLERQANTYQKEDDLINVLIETMKKQEELQAKIKKTLNSESTSTNYNYSNSKPAKKSSGGGLGDVLIGMAVADALTSKRNKDDDYDNVSGYTEEELDDYCLTDYQKDLVRRGDYEPCQFEEEDLEEDDYYYEDD